MEISMNGSEDGLHGEQAEEKEAAHEGKMSFGNLKR